MSFKNKKTVSRPKNLDTYCMFTLLTVCNTTLTAVHVFDVSTAVLVLLIQFTNTVLTKSVFSNHTFAVTCDLILRWKKVQDNIFLLLYRC